MPRLTKGEHLSEVKGALVVPNVSDGFSLDIQRLARRSQVLPHEGRTFAGIEVNLYRNQQRALNAPK